MGNFVSKFSKKKFYFYVTGCYTLLLGDMRDLNSSYKIIAKHWPAPSSKKILRGFSKLGSEGQKFEFFQTFSKLYIEVGEGHWTDKHD